MTDHDDVLKDLETALQVEPSRAFADDVRARVAAETQVRIRRMWWGLAAAATVTLATVVLWRSPAQQASAAIPDPEPESVISADATTPAPATVRRVASVARPVVESSEPRLEVITNQPALIRQLWAEYGTRALPETTVEVEPPAPVTEVKPPVPVAVDPIVVPPIVVSELGASGGRGGAAPGIRRADATKETR